MTRLQAINYADDFRFLILGYTKNLCKGWGEFVSQVNIKSIVHGANPKLQVMTSNIGNPEDQAIHNLDD